MDDDLTPAELAIYGAVYAAHIGSTTAVSPLMVENTHPTDRERTDKAIWHARNAVLWHRESMKRTRSSRRG